MTPTDGTGRDDDKTAQAPTAHKPAAHDSAAQDSVAPESHELVRRAAAELYAGAPGDFIAKRTALVKSAKSEGHKDAAKDITALRKPSVAAWALNQVVHHRDEVIQRLADLGARLRHATAALDAAAIAGMRKERDAALADLVTAAAGAAKDAGQNLTAAVTAEVRDTGIAALADAAAEAVLRSGTLTRALSYSGFGEVDLSEAAATTSTGVVLTSIRGGRKRPAGATRSRAANLDRDRDVGADTGQEADEDELEGEDGTSVLEDVSGSSEPDEDDGRDQSDESDGAEALAEAATAEEHERRISQAEEAVAAAKKEVGRHSAAVEAARNRTDATRQRVRKLEEQLEKARTEDGQALEQLTTAVVAAKKMDEDLAAARTHLDQLTGET